MYAEEASVGETVAAPSNTPLFVVDSRFSDIFQGCTERTLS